VQAKLEAVANPRRREILRLVWDRELSAGQIAERFEVSWPAISQNLGVLRKAGLIIERRDANRRLYRADREAAGSLAAVLEESWRTDLAKLQEAVKDRP
jgi:DNA-binding transcriptional ArsR family regulator